MKSLKLKQQNATVKVNTCLNERYSAIQTVNNDIGIIYAIHAHNEMWWILMKTFVTEDLSTEPMKSSDIGVYKDKKKVAVQVGDM